MASVTSKPVWTCAEIIAGRMPAGRIAWATFRRTCPEKMSPRPLSSMASAFAAAGVSQSGGRGIGAI